jgi:hypothetical protein
MRTPHFGTLVGATACGTLIARGIGWAIAQPNAPDHETTIALFGLSGAVLAGLATIIGQIVVFRFRFTVSQLIELGVACAIVMWQWHMYEVHLTADNIARELAPHLLL